MQENPEPVACGAKLKGQVEAVTWPKHFMKFESLNSRHRDRRAKPLLGTVKCPPQLDDPGNNGLAREMPFEERKVGRNL